MSIPNIQQQLYLKKALNEDTDGMFDHPTLEEGSYVHSKKQLKKAVKGSKREIVKAMKRGNKKDAEFWMQNKKDAESQMSESIAEGLLRRYSELTEARQYYGGHLSIYGTPTQAKIHLDRKYGPGAYDAILKASKNHKGSLAFTTDDVHRVGTAVKNAAQARAAGKQAHKGK